MNLSELWIEIEAELSWRQQELRFLNNQIERLQNEDDKRTLRRSALLMLYAHFEGFYKFALGLYIRAINEENLTCSQVNSFILASSFNEVFKAMRNPNSKCEVFRNTLPDDSKLHRFARNVDFLDALDDKLLLTVRIPDSVIDTESNLKPKVISKLLYSVGLEHDLFESNYPSINRLLSTRNKIGHGERRNGLDEAEFNELYTIALSILVEIKSKIMESLMDKRYLKAA